MNDTESLVIKDIAERQLMGVKKYGITVAENPLPLKQWLQHAYEESLDKAIYLKRAIQEITECADATTSAPVQPESPSVPSTVEDPPNKNHSWVEQVTKNK